MNSRFWTRTTLLLTAATFAALTAWWLMESSTAGALALILFVAAVASSYLAISEQEDEIGPRVSPEERAALAQWVGARERENELQRRLALGRLRDRAERHRAKRVGAHDPAPPEPCD